MTHEKSIGTKLTFV